MFGKYYDNRPHLHLTQFYSRTPYLDTQIFNIQVRALQQSRKAKNRTTKAMEAIQRTKDKSDLLTAGLQNSKIARAQLLDTFAVELQLSRRQTIVKNDNQMKKFAESRIKSKEDDIKSKIYLESLLQTTATKAASRVASVRRWE